MHEPAVVPEPFFHKKSLGQHFLNSPVVPRWLADAGAVGVGDTVLELGPGTGALTAELLARGAHVRAIEADSRALERLADTFSAALKSGQLALHHGDLRELGADDIARIFKLKSHSYKLVANIPYYLSGRLFRTFLETTAQPSSLVFLVQKEIATRIARDEKASLLSLSVRTFGTPTYIRTVGRGHFTPPPKVDSAILAVTDITYPFQSEGEREQFFALLHHGLGQKRKQLLGNLAPHYGRERVAAALAALSLALTVRGEDLPLAAWRALAHSLSPA